ncbi:MAG: VanZ family protein [Lentisphaerae bacterium]|nr:MAG: VanZ family protein [Lentisphaerota bacterium]
MEHSIAGDEENRFSVRISRLLFWGSVMGILVLATLPPQGTALEQCPDKPAHAVAFGMLFLLGLGAYPRLRVYPGIIAGAMGIFLYGGGIELIQAGLPWRSCSLADFIWDGVGVVMAYFGYLLFHRFLPSGWAIGKNSKGEQLPQKK